MCAGGHENFLGGLSEVIPEPVSANCNMVTIQDNIQHKK